MKKSRQDLVDFMWKKYPEDNHLERREGMLEAFDFMTGVIDQEEKEKEKIKEDILHKLGKK